MLRSSMTKMLLVSLMTLLSVGTSPAQATADKQTPKSVPTLVPYRLAGDDVLSINVANFPTLSCPQLTVPPDGKIAMQLLEPFSILGKTTTEVAQMLTEKWNKYGINPSVSVSLVQKRGDRARPFMTPGDRLQVPERHNWIFVSGAVARPGFYIFKPGDRLLDALNFVGGPTSNANLKKISLRHSVKGKQFAKVTEINFLKFLQKGDLKCNVPLTADDVFFVPEKTRTTPEWQEILWGNEVYFSGGLHQGGPGIFTGWNPFR
jgi:polysaccharide biosynthesis/export protein